MILNHGGKMKRITVIHRGNELEAVNIRPSFEDVESGKECDGCCFPMYESSCQSAPPCSDLINGVRCGWVWRIL